MNLHVVAGQSHWFEFKIIKGTYWHRSLTELTVITKRDYGISDFKIIRECSEYGATH
jgi:hypothetical protein